MTVADVAVMVEVVPIENVAVWALTYGLGAGRQRRLCLQLLSPSASFAPLMYRVRDKLLCQRSMEGECNHHPSLGRPSRPAAVCCIL